MYSLTEEVESCATAVQNVDKLVTKKCGVERSRIEDAGRVERMWSSGRFQCTAGAQYRAKTVMYVVAKGEWAGVLAEGLLVVVSVKEQSRGAASMRRRCNRVV